MDWVYAPKLKSDGRNQPAKPAISLARSEVGAVQKTRNYRTCTLLLDEPIVQNIKGRKKNCPFMEQVIKERALDDVF